jgi:N-acetyl-anhydromuramyl-L-alanine amidase AmpD
MVEIVDRSKTLPKHPNKRYATRTTHKIDTIIIHHSATTPGRDDPLAFAHYHIEALGWAGIGYHYVVEPSGIIYKCQPLTVVSNHASGANTRSIGICLAGNFDNQVPTDPQWDAAIELVILFLTSI